jgi:hypothetical protein
MRAIYPILISFILSSCSILAEDPELIQSSANLGEEIVRDILENSSGTKVISKDL